MLKNNNYYRVKQRFSWKQNFCVWCQLCFLLFWVVNLQENLEMKNLFKLQSSYLEKHQKIILLCCNFLEEFFSVSSSAKLETSSQIAFMFALQDFPHPLCKGHAWLMLCCPRYSCLVQRTMAPSVPSLDLSHPSDPATYPSLAQFLPMYPGFL